VAPSAAGAPSRASPSAGKGGYASSGGARAPPPNEPPPPPPPDGGNRQICKFFLSGSCTYGSSCRNLHESPKPAEPYASEECWEDGSSGLFGPVGGATSSSAIAGQGSYQFGGGQASPWPAVCPAAPKQPEKPQWGVLDLEDAECGICFDMIKRKGERFGMLEQCDHAFCLSCIRSWRKQREQQDRNNLRLCPICRNESFFVLPSDTLILDPKVKLGIVNEYKAEMGKIPCKLFDYGRGKCSFGNSCFYAHLNPDGTRYVPPPVRWMAGASGKQVHGDVKLSAFLDRHI